MNLREVAEQDLVMTLEDSEMGFGMDCDITNPAGTTETFQVQSGDVHLLLDLDNDSSVSVRTAHVAVRISTLTAKGFGIPKRGPDENKNPWIFEFADANGIKRKFTVVEARPDRSLGIVTIILELIKV